MTQPKPKKPVVKKTTTTTPKKPKSVSERIGNLTLRDVKNAGEDALQLSTLGVYGKIKKSLGGEYKHKKIGEKKYGGKVTKAKNGKSFPDLNKDGKVTKADILKGRGVIAKNGKPVEKAFLGKMLGGVGKSVLGGLAGKAIGGLMGGKNGKTIKKSKSGTSMKKCRGGCK
jgi:hypothetical protein